MFLLSSNSRVVHVSLYGSQSLIVSVFAFLNTEVCPLILSFLVKI